MKILVTRHDKIGDFVTMLPVCKVLKEQTSHTIVMLVAKVNADLARALDFIDDVIEYTDDSNILLQKIKAYNFDVSISGYIDTALGKVLFRSHIPTRIAPATKIAQLFFNKRVKQRRSEVKMREFEYNLHLLRAFDERLSLVFQRPLLLNPMLSDRNFVIFHTGFGGSSDGNLTLDDYLKLAKRASQYTKVVFSFGPDDGESKAYITTKLDFEATIRDDFETLIAFTRFIATAKLFVSTSTGPMHLAGMTNTPTLSFFGSSLFASEKRWGTVSDEALQHNFSIEADYSRAVYETIEQTMVEILHG